MSTESQGVTNPVSLDQSQARSAWAVGSLLDAVAAALLGPLALIQCIFVVTAFMSPLLAPAMLPAVAHVGVALVCLALVRSPTASGYAVGLMCLVLAADLVIAGDPEGPFFITVMGTIPLVAMMPVLLYEGRWAVMAGALAALGFGLCAGLVHPDWGDHPVAYLLTAIVCYQVVALLMIRLFRRITLVADRQEDAAVREAQLATQARALHQTAAEHIRVLHDTVLNTFGALANEGSGRFDERIIRDRCRSDLARIKDLQGQRRDDGLGVSLFRFLELDALAGLAVKRTGLTAEQLRPFDDRIPAVVAVALRGCVAEALLNVAKHAGVQYAIVDVTRNEGVLRIRVIDQGRGFDGRPRPGRGLAESVIGRARDHGIEASVTSTPERGTTVTLAYDIRSSPTPRTFAGPDELRALLRSTGMTWISAALGAGLAIETVNSGGRPTLVHVSLLVSFGLALLGRRLCGRDKTLPGWLTASCVAVVPLMVLAAFHVVAHAPSEPYRFQAAGFVGVLALLAIYAKNLRPFVNAVALALAAAAVVIARTTNGDSYDSVSMLMMLLQGAGLVAAWVTFQKLFAVRAEHHARTWRATRQDLLTQTAYASAAVVQEQWNEAGLRSSLDLLARLADGSASITDPDVRRQCAAEERYLRQVSVLSMDAVLMSAWFARALAKSRERDVHLRIHAGGIEIEDAREADAFGSLMMDVIERCPGGTDLVINLLSHQGGARMMISSPVNFFTDEIRARHQGALDLKSNSFSMSHLLEATLR